MTRSTRSGGASQTPSNTNTSQPGSIPAPVRARPPRKAKQAALEQKIWTNDLPATRKRALSPTADAAAQLDKQKKAKGRSTVEGKQLDQDSSATPKVVPPRFVRKTNVLRAADLESSDEDDVPLRVARSRPAPTVPGRVTVTPSIEKLTHLEDFQDPNEEGQNVEDDLSDDEVDLEAREQAVAEQSESDDEVLASMEAGGDTQALGARLAAEQPKWSKTEQKRRATGKRVASEDEASDSEPARVKRSQNKANRHANEKAAAPSRTQLRAQQEQPVFKTPAQHAHISQSSASTTSQPSLSAPPIPMPEAATSGDEDSSDSDSDVQLVGAMAPQDYRIVYPTQGGPLSLKVQHPDIQDLIKATISRLERKLVLEDAFPDAHNRGRGVRQTMVEAARELTPKDKFRSLLTRLITDAHFLKSLASIPNQRISTFRGKLKEKSNISVVSYYRLVPGETQDHVAWLLSHLIYVYPNDFEKRQVSNDRPYRAPLVMHILRDAFFKGSKSFYNRHEDVFTSSLPGRSKREIPLVMLALVGTAIHASLTDWKFGNCSEHSHFSTDRYMDGYAENKILLEEIKRSAPLKYHTMMHKLFNEASGATPTILTAPLGTSAIAHLDLDGMEED